MNRHTYTSDRIILGTVQFGLDYGINNLKGKVPKNEVFEILEKAAAEGIPTLDTADGYGDASKSIGEFIQSTNHRFLINTKFKYDPHVNLEQQLQNSLKLLHRDTINVYFYHDFKDVEKFPQIVEQLCVLKEQKRINQIGVSVYGNDQFDKAAEIMEVDVIQIPFNLLDNHYQKGSLIKKAKQNGKQIQARSVFLQGLLFRDPDTYPEQLTPLKRYIKVLHQIVEEVGKEIEQLALSYVMAQNELDHIIIGVDNRDQLCRNLEQLSLSVNESVIEKINNIHVSETQLLYPTNWK